MAKEPKLIAYGTYGCVVIPPINPDNITPHTEGFQAIIWHLLVAHPDLQMFGMKWESVK